METTSMATTEDVEKMQEEQPHYVEVTDPTMIPGELVTDESLAAEEFITIIRAEETQKKFQSNFLHNLFDLYLEGAFNDVNVRCQNGQELQIPGFLLAAVSPVFKVAAAGAGTELTDAPDYLHLPDVEAEDLHVFIRRLCQLSVIDNEDEEDEDEDMVTLVADPFQGDEGQSDMAAIQRVMDLLCLQFKGSEDPVDSLLLLEGDWNTLQDAASNVVPPLPPSDSNKENLGENVVRSHPPPPAPPPPKRRRPAKPKKDDPDEPWVKTVVMDTPRNPTVYGLRTKLKRKRFADEVSEPSDLDLDELDDDDLSSEPNSDYEPDHFEVNEEDEDEEVESDEDDVEEDDLVNRVTDDEELDEEDGEEDDIIDARLDPEAEESDALSMFTVHVGLDGKIDAGDAPTSSDPSNRIKFEGEAPLDEDPISSSSPVKEALGKVVSIMEGEEDLAFQGRKLFAEISNPRSLLKSKISGPVVLFCSVCESQCSNMSELKHHAALSHPGSRFFIMPRNHPHRDCAPCSAMMRSYEAVMASDATTVTLRDLCFPCPHCRRRFVGHLGGLANHLANDHRNIAALDLGDKEEGDFEVLSKDDPKLSTCEFCELACKSVGAYNKHLLYCPKNDCGHSAGLFCNICGKMFVQAKHLKDHLVRHGKDKLSRERDYFCRLCPVACVSEANLERHVEKEHSHSDKDEGFVLHEGCQRCTALQESYLMNKITGAIGHREMVFKCPHCCMILFANQKHAPRYLQNHVNKFHTDSEVNDFTLGEANDPSAFVLRSKSDPDVLTCEFCALKSTIRCNHNAHLSTCKASTVPCRPGYMCDTCGFIAGTGRHLRDHLETHNDPRTYSCNICDYAGRSLRYLKAHVKKIHTREGQRKRVVGKYIPCPKCGKLRKEGASMKNHIKKCGNGPNRVRCEECDMEFKRREDMQAHALIHLGQVSCPFHNILFKQESEVFQHVNQAEPGDKFPKLQCCMCEKSFKHMCMFMKHMRRHLRISPYRCGICGKTVNTYASLQLHQQRIHGAVKLKSEKTFSCDQCSKSFGTKGHLKEHLDGVHNRANSVKCCVCSKSFNTVKRMKKHLFNSHKEVSEQYRQHSQVEAFTDSSLRLDILTME